MADQLALRRIGFSRRCSIASPTTSRTRNSSRAMQRVISKRRLRAGGAARSRLAVQHHAARRRTWIRRRCPYARRSVINFGLPALSGQTASSLEVHRPRARHPAGDPRLRAAHPAGLAAGARARDRRDLDHHNVIGVEIPGSSGRSRCRSSSWSGPRSISRPARCEIADLAPSRVA